MPKKVWSIDEESALKLVGARFSLEELSHMFPSKTKVQISDKLEKMGIKKDSETKSRIISEARKAVEEQKRANISERMSNDPNAQNLREALEVDPEDQTEEERVAAIETARTADKNRRAAEKLRQSLEGKDKELTLTDFISYDEIVTTLNPFEVEFFVNQLTSIAKTFSRNELTSIDRNNIKLYCQELIHLRRIDEAIKKTPGNLINLSKTRDNATKRLETHEQALNATRTQRIKQGGDKGVSFLSFVEEFGYDIEGRYDERMTADKTEEKEWNEMRAARDGKS